MSVSYIFNRKDQPSCFHLHVYYRYKTTLLVFGVKLSVNNSKLVPPVDTISHLLHTSSL